MSGSEGGYKIAALYKFVNILDVDIIRSFIQDTTSIYNIHGGLIIASEGLNGTIAGTPHYMDAFINELKGIELFHDIDIKYSFATDQPFFRMRITIKNEIITMGQSIANPIIAKGIDVDPSAWNEIIQRPDVLLIDTRNDYEIKLGSFVNAINPNTVKFSEFPAYVEKNLNPHTNPKIAMYCTGGIRCEKASSYLLSLGFSEIYQLKGGILKYLEDVPVSSSLYKGECYVFDHRTSVGHGLTLGASSLCRSCRHPLQPLDMQSDKYKEGIHCSYCYDHISEDKLRAAEERNLQMKLSRENNTAHLGYKKKRRDGSGK